MVSSSGLAVGRETTVADPRRLRDGAPAVVAEAAGTRELVVGEPHRIRVTPERLPPRG